MPLMFRFFLYVGLLQLLAPELAFPANPTRYVARLQIGNVIEGNTLSEWHSPNSIPKLENQAILDSSNPMRWLIDRSLAPPQPPESFIEFLSGDRLPCTVQAFKTGSEFPYTPLPPHLLVNYAGINPTNLERQTSLLRVDTRTIRRIVWRYREGQTYEPGTAFMVAGNVIRFRSMRFASSAATLLTDSGIRRISYSDLAEIHIPTSDYWPAAFDELAVLSAAGQSRLFQIDSSDGLIATTSLERYLPRAVGDSRDVNRWVHGIQPAWSLDVLWVPQGAIWCRRSFPPTSLPLSRVAIKRFEQRSVLGEVYFPLQVNRNVFGGALRSGTRDVGWGIGVHAFAELEYELPPETSGMRSEFGIDASMNEGGCVLPRILDSSANGAVLYEGPVLTGSNSIVDSGQLALTAAPNIPRRVVLQVDPVLKNRPRGADPFDIRDNANWIEPVVEFDAARLQQQLEQRILNSVPGWREWKVIKAAESQLKWTNFFAEAPGNLGEYVSTVSVSGGPLTLTFNRKLADSDRWLVIDAVRAQSTGTTSKVAVRIGERQFEHELPAYDKSRTDFRPIVLSLSNVANRQAVDVEIQQLPAENAFVLWRLVSVTKQHPLLFELFEDDPATLVSSSGPAEKSKFDVDDQQKHFGVRSLVISTDKILSLPASNTLLIRERPQLGEYRFLRFAVRKLGGGQMRARVNHASDQERPAIFRTGPKRPNELTTRYLSDTPLKDDWQVFTRDLYGDFGNIDVSGLTFDILDGTKAWIDHVYFARTQGDFELIKNH